MAPMMQGGVKYHIRPGARAPVARNSGRKNGLSTRPREKQGIIPDLLFNEVKFYELKGIRSDGSHSNYNGAAVTGVEKRAAKWLVELRQGAESRVGLHVKKVGNYCWKISGVSAMHTAGIKEAMIKGQGRWGLYAQRRRGVWGQW